jgi:hypothetical protein
LPKNKFELASGAGVALEGGTDLPVLDISELPGTPQQRDLEYRSQLPHRERSYLRDHEKVMLTKRSRVEMPAKPLTAIGVAMKAAHAETIDHIGYGKKPIVASVNPLEGSTQRSRYEAEHGRDEEQAAEDLGGDFPQVIDKTVISLSESQGIEYEENVPGVPFRQEREGSIILLNLAKDDLLGRKFSAIAGWGYPRYTSADAPASYINLIARRWRQDPSYLIRHTYDARDGQTYPLSRGFERSVRWLIDRTDENPEGFVEYKKYPYGGMRNQGWRDSASALVHTDGSWANSDHGIAALDVQSVSFDALRNSARIYREFYKDEKKASDLDERSWNIQRRILHNGWTGGHFVSGWDRTESNYSRKIETKTSAIGRLLRSGVLKTDNPEVKEKLHQTIRGVMAPDMLTRWGIRTLSSDEAGYVPFSYHIGPIWPHDTNEIAAGMSDHGFFGLDRVISTTTTHLHEVSGVFYEHISGDDSEEPTVPDRDTYVYSEFYDELYLWEQVPPIAQTWAATTEYAKQRRLSNTPLHAADPEKFAFEKEIWKTLSDSVKKAAYLYEPELAMALSA